MADLPTIEGFRLLEELGSGSLSSVYKAIEEPLGRTVALKILKNTIASDSPFAAQLEREARVLATLSHPNIGLLYAFAKSDAGMHLVLEFVDGFSLATIAKKRPTLAPEVVAVIGAAVARGLAHAHSRGVVHRDVKPANILVSRRGEVKVFDFGIAQRTVRVDEPVSLAPLRLENIAAFGTPAYMAPEQILGEGVDARSDLFSLGVVLYQLLCGARPFERGDEADQRPTAHRIRRDPPIPLHRRAPEVPVALERIVMRAIQKLPADRFHTADAMAEHLEELAMSRAGLRGPALLVAALEGAGLVRPSEAAEGDGPARRKQASARRAIAGLALLGAAGRRRRGPPPGDGAPRRRRRRGAEPSTSRPLFAWLPAGARDALGRGVGRRTASRRDALRAPDRAARGHALRHAGASGRAGREAHGRHRPRRDPHDRRRDEHSYRRARARRDDAGPKRRAPTRTPGRPKENKR